MLESGFPTAATGVYIERLAEELQISTGTKLGIYAHVAPSGDVASDKRRSDLLGKATRAVLCNDEEMFETLCVEGSWSTREHQAMLRALGCNPAAIDGDAGELTRSATEFFQEEWNLGWHHPDGAEQPLAVTGALDDATRLALRRAYLLSLAGQFTAEQFHGPRWSGCGAFNPRGGDEGDDRRRVSIALYPHRQPSSFPCVEGNASACRTDQVDARSCRFYRLVVDEPRTRIAKPTFFDFEWLALPSGKINLSVLTSLPDGERPVFEVRRYVGDYDGRVKSGDGVAPERGELVATLPGIVDHGVAVALWSPPADWSPFDFRNWWHDAEDDDDDQAAGRLDGFRPPLFRVRGEEYWADSRPPGRRLDRTIVEDAGPDGIALTTDGHALRFEFDGKRAWPGERRRADEHIHVVGWQSHLRKYLRDGEVP